MVCPETAEKVIFSEKVKLKSELVWQFVEQTA